MNRSPQPGSEPGEHAAAQDGAAHTLVHRDRRLAGRASAWVRQFDASHLKPLIICRGPIRKEAMDVFEEMGIDGYGILLSEKDSITYSNALAPELRQLTDPHRIHRVPDYTGASREERDERIAQIIAIARDNGYDSVFAGYGFMAEDETMVGALEAAGLTFIGPCAATVRRAGNKDLAKRTAITADVSVTPGVDNATTLTLLRRAPDAGALRALVAEYDLNVDPHTWDTGTVDDMADAVLTASYAKGVDLFDVDALGEELERQVAGLYEANPDYRIRLKAIGGGGGKGQRILTSPRDHAGDDKARAAAAAADTPAALREILSEVKAGGVGDNKNVLAELNIETVRHQEIQVIGNGEWCVTIGGRDCSLQNNEQKLLEVSVTVEELAEAAAAAREAGDAEKATRLGHEREILEAMEAQAVRFGKAVGLNSVSTFECIADVDRHFFMEMNTRIQVEHRVSELCYALRFANPDDSSDALVVESLVELMVLLAAHGSRLPEPQRIRRETSALEMRLNATDPALRPHAGGIIASWSPPSDTEIRDDQGISLPNPDTGVFVRYHVAGAYDSNIALLLTTASSRQDSYERMAEIIRTTRLTGPNLATNLNFHYGLLHWLLGQDAWALPTTAFVLPYLTAVGMLKREVDNLDFVYAYDQLVNREILQSESGGDAAVGIKRAADAKASLLSRALHRLFDEPHLLAGWLSRNRSRFSVTDGKVHWLVNVIDVVADSYHFLNMERSSGNPALYQIWDHDADLLHDALDFYAEVQSRLGTDDWATVAAALDGACPASFSSDEWAAARAAHRGYQTGLDVFSILPYAGHATGFFDLRCEPDLTVHIPETLRDADLQAQMTRVLSPPPAAPADEIIAETGGMFYSREAPDRPPFVEAGTHFEVGDPLYIIEVMKMFNKVHAEFEGTVDAVLTDDDGTIITKGQSLYKVTPDEAVTVESPADIAARRHANTRNFLDSQA